MEILVQLLWTILTIGLFYIAWREYQDQANTLSLLKWFSGIVFALGYCIAAYDTHPLGIEIGRLGSILFIFFTAIGYLLRNSREK